VRLRSSSAAVLSHPRQRETTVPRSVDEQPAGIAADPGQQVVEVVRDPQANCRGIIFCACRSCLFEVILPVIRPGTGARTPRRVLHDRAAVADPDVVAPPGTQRYSESNHQCSFARMISATTRSTSSRWIPSRKEVRIVIPSRERPPQHIDDLRARVDVRRVASTWSCRGRREAFVRLR